MRWGQVIELTVMTVALVVVTAALVGLLVMLARHITREGND